MEDCVKEVIGADDDDNEKGEEDFEDNKENREEIEEEKKKRNNEIEIFEIKHSQVKIKKMEWPKDLDIFEI